MLHEECGEDGAMLRECGEICTLCCRLWGGIMLHECGEDRPLLHDLYLALQVVGCEGYSVQDLDVVPHHDEGACASDVARRPSRGPREDNLSAWADLHKLLHDLIGNPIGSFEGSLVGLGG